MKIKKQTIIGMILVVLGIIPLFFTKDLGITAVLLSSGLFVINSEDEWMIDLIQRIF